MTYEEALEICRRYHDMQRKYPRMSTTQEVDQIRDAQEVLTRVHCAEILEEVNLLFQSCACDSCKATHKRMDMMVEEAKARFLRLNCTMCGDNIEGKGQKNKSTNDAPMCEDCANSPEL